MRIWPEDFINKIICEDCIEVMREMPENSIDAIVTDPPYGLQFMGKDWDCGLPNKRFWGEMLRVAKPGCHLLAFGGTRTFHRLACAIEDAGWEIRDTLMWVYGQGFPKSHNIGKAVDKLQGNEREAYLVPIAYPDSDCWGRPNSNSKGNDVGFETQRTGTRKDMDGKGNQIKTKGFSPWEGWGTALKPAWEPIIMARKPVEGAIAENVLKWGTGGINVGGCKVELVRSSTPLFKLKKGRYPANVIHDGSDEVVELFPETKPVDNIQNIDKSSVSRFFYCAKVSKRERGEGNNHPTVKPIKLIEYLIRLITREGQIILDPFFGSGTMGIACNQLGRRWIGIEKEDGYCKIAEGRLAQGVL